jgi:tripartite-type tricarboxylate transporter receptor subunit TctC
LVKVFRREFLLLGGSAVAAAIGSCAWAQAYPARPVRVIVPFGPGGPTDVFARLMAQKLSEQTGTQFYIENIGGAGGNIGATRASQAAPDGYTLLVDGANLVVNPALYPHVAYDPLKDFDPVTVAVTAPAILTVHPSVPAKTVKDLVALIKANAGKYSYASPGTGTPPHLVGELFRLSLGLDLVHVPFNGAEWLSILGFQRARLWHDSSDRAAVSVVGRGRTGQRCSTIDSVIHWLKWIRCRCQQ